MKLILKKKQWFVLITTCVMVVILFAAISCGEPINKDNSDTNIIALKMNETFVDNTINVSFIEVLDNRCPKSECYLCYGSKADVVLSIDNSENENAIINLSIIGCIDELDNESIQNCVDTLEYRFQLIKLLPYPDIEPINKDDYVAKIKIIKL